MRGASRATVVALALVLAACQEPTRSVGPEEPGSPEDARGSVAQGVVPGQYIVVFRDGVADPGGVAAGLVRDLGGSLLHTYTVVIKGFAARLPAAAALALQHNPLVALVEADQLMTADVTQNMDANGDPWGLDRIDQGALPLSRTYTYTSTGAGVHAYIIDTGIWTLHAQFGGRANNVYDAMGLTVRTATGTAPTSRGPWAPPPTASPRASCCTACAC